ncbi:hypothetical protein PybrP1_004687 [[Pythium] brassicae (nom. inval.)]|nr:hypothetical protein PybrP1_004687 [[Pythium] brassicae (nom. inval.)]
MLPAITVVVPSVDAIQHQVEAAAAVAAAAVALDPQLDQPDHHRAPFSLLLKHWGVDIAAALVASFGVSPFITVVDRAIAENASGRRTLMNGVKELSRSFVERPLQFCKSREFLWIFGLYSATYATANSVGSYYEWKEADGQMPKLLATTAVNMSLVIAKDKAFAQMFGVTKTHKFPVTSMGLFAVRDALTVVSCFHAPKIIMEHLREQGMNEKLATGLSQIGAPVAVQFASTPLHLLGLDLYNHPVADRAARIQFIQREYWRSSLARVARIGPAFGIGGIGNTSFRQHMRARLSG